jgi:hypothetical protein
MEVFADYRDCVRGERRAHCAIDNHEHAHSHDADFPSLFWSPLAKYSSISSSGSMAYG